MMTPDLTPQITALREAVAAWRSTGVLSIPQALEVGRRAEALLAAYDTAQAAPVGMVVEIPMHIYPDGTMKIDWRYWPGGKQCDLATGAPTCIIRATLPLREIPVVQGDLV